MKLPYPIIMNGINVMAIMLLLKNIISTFRLGLVFGIILQMNAAAVTDTTCDPSGGGTECKDTNAECPANESKCACKTGYKVDPNDNTKCLLIITQVVCASNDQTNGDTTCRNVDANSDCPATGDKCECKVGYAGSDTCTKKAVTDTDCDPNKGVTECQNVDTNAECPANGKKCACKTGYKVDPNDNTKCLQIITEVNCASNDQTTGDATCRTVDANSDCPAAGNKCECKVGYTGLDTCTKKAITDVSCTSGTSGNTMCQGLDANYECSTSLKCVCKTGYTGTATCTKSPITDVGCTPGANGDTTCQGLDANSKCSASSKCACKTGYTGTATCTKSPISQIDCTSGDKTNGDTKCKGLDTNSECPSGAKKCACKTGYTGTDTCSKESSADTVKTSTAMTALSFLVMIVGRLF